MARKEMTFNLLRRRLTCLVSGHEVHDAQTVWSWSGYSTKYCWRCFRQFRVPQHVDFMSDGWMKRNELFCVSAPSRWTFPLLVAVGTAVLVFLSTR